MPENKQEKSATGEPPVIELGNVSLKRGGKPVLRDADWTVLPGEHWFILGKNGSGKTSLLEIVTGYLWASTGTVKILGETYGKTNLPELRKEIGYVAPWVMKSIPKGETAGEVVAAGSEAAIRFFGALTGELEAKTRFWLDRFGCGGYFETPFERLSSGEQLKVLMARSFVRGHKILILDEAFAALDLGTRSRLYKILEDLAVERSAPSVILVTHQLDDILPFFSHGMILKEGKIFFSGKKEAALAPGVLQKAFDTAGLEIFERRGRYYASFS